MNLKKLEQKARAATPGPWNHEPERYSAKNVIGIKPIDDRWIASCQPEFNGTNNADFIASFNPTTALELIEALKEARRVIERLVERIDYNGGIGEYKGGPSFVVQPARDWLKRWGE